MIDIVKLKKKIGAKKSAPRVGSGELLARTLDIIENMMDEDDCWFDHHGYCQAHSWFYTEPKCPNARARELLKECGRAG